MDTNPNDVNTDSVDNTVVAELPIYQPANGQLIKPLDVLRGIGILGGLLVSIWMFGGFTYNKQTFLFGHTGGWKYKLYGAVSILFEGKMRAIIGLVFGAGLLLFMAKNESSKRVSDVDLYMRRNMWLMGLGIINAIVFLWSYDMLFQLGIMGILLFPFLKVKPKGLLIASTICLLIFCGKNYWKYADDKGVYKKYVAVTLVEKQLKKDSAERHRKDSITAITLSKDTVVKVPAIKDTAIKKTKDSAASKAKKDTLTKEQAKDKAAWEGLVKSMVYDPKNDEGENKSRRENSYNQLWDNMLGMSQSREAEWTYRTGVWEMGMSIFLGLALFKLGFFSFHYKQRTYLLIGVAGVIIGFLLGLFRLHFHWAAISGYEKYITTKWVPDFQFVAFERLSLAVAYAALVMWIMKQGWLHYCIKAFAVVGRLALTNYLLQSIFLTWFFTGFGSGNFGKLSQWQLYFFVSLVVLVQVVFSVLWLRKYPQGPAEWLWRSAIAKRWLPFKKPQDSSVSVDESISAA